jgi:MEDS: MEthanogen/methylotroph, DcmR Sensory domain
MQNAVAGTPMATVDTKHGELVDAEGHICAFFHSVDEEYQVLLPVMREGFDRGERIFYIVDPDLRGDHLARLSAGGLTSSVGRQVASSSCSTGPRPTCPPAVWIRNAS